MSDTPATLPQPSVGDAAPPIRATTSTGEEFDLAGLLGHAVAVWFFPRANTPG